MPSSAPRSATDKTARCVVCDKTFSYRGCLPKYCGAECRRSAHRRKFLSVVKSKDHALLGEAAELIVAADLMRRGILVFQNIARTGPADLVAWIPGRHEVAFLDVKGITTAYVLQDGTPSISYKGALFDEDRKVWIVVVAGTEVIYPPHLAALLGLSSN